jgi:transposase
MFDADIQAEILVRFFRDRQSIRGIARDLGISRKSTRLIIERKTVKFDVTRGIRTSILDPYKSKVEDLLKIHDKIPAIAVLQIIRKEGYSGGYSTVRDWISGIRGKHGSHNSRDAFFMLDFDAGECAQVDWGEFDNNFDDSGPIHAFSMVLCYSRLLYIEFTRAEKFEDFIRCHENALNFFNGVPEKIWYDNLTCAVSERMGKIVKFNARFMAYTGYHGYRPHACNIAKGNERKSLNH